MSQRITLANAESAYLAAKVKFEKWRNEFEIEWNGPQAETFVAMLWGQMTPQQHAMMQQMDPVMYAELAAKMGPAGGKNANT